MKYLYGVSNTMSWSHTIRMILMPRRSTKMSSRRFFSSRKASARKEERAMDIDARLSDKGKAPLQRPGLFIRPSKPQMQM